MRWTEIDLDKKIWTVPASRMKAGREHREPLSPRAVAILGNLAKVKTGEFVLPGHGRCKPLSNMAMEMVLRRMKIEDATVHGSAPVSGIGRATFPTSRARSWRRRWPM
jgi:integrase